MARQGGVSPGPGVYFLGKLKRLEFLTGLEKAIQDPSGPGESVVLGSIQDSIDKNFNGEILRYAAHYSAAGKKSRRQDANTATTGSARPLVPGTGTGYH